MDAPIMWYLTHQCICSNLSFKIQIETYFEKNLHGADIPDPNVSQGHLKSLHAKLHSKNVTCGHLKAHEEAFFFNDFPLAKIVK